ncbi:MAG: CarD family transcriptional regulator, partial [Acidimicrobiia bacterium]|nr:CarD family transcriptional regulator [Acidimicrobiia bacterium]
HVGSDHQAAALDQTLGLGFEVGPGRLADEGVGQVDRPVRIDFWGDVVEEIRAFDVGTQRSTEALQAATTYPAREVRTDEETRGTAASLIAEEPWASAAWDRLAAGVWFPGMESWLPWLAPPATTIDEAASPEIVVFDLARCVARSEELVKEEADLAGALAGTWGADAPPAGLHPPLYLDLGESLSRRDHLDAPPHAAGPNDAGIELRAFDATPGDPGSVAAAINRWKERKLDIVLAMDGAAAAQRVASVLAESGAGLPVVEAVRQIEPSVIPSGIHHGFVAPALRLGVVGEQEIAGRRRSHRKSRPSVGAVEADGYRDLAPGSCVVHRHHGLGGVEGLVHREMAGVERDYLLVAYHGTDRLYVPTDQLAAVRPYVGGETPRLSRMGGSDWDATRSKVRKAVAVVAEEVVALHRKRARATGRAIDGDTPWQAEFEAAFPFEETADQLSAIEDVKRDMERSDPMDRLIFGDVGFGKTEVALRAAFKAVQSGHQVAVLVPTTLLAQQHFATFQERLAPYPVRVEMLSRFLTAGQQRSVINAVSDGAVDIVIGTHRLL